MPRSRFAFFSHLSGALLLSGLLACAQAAELGEPAVRSHLGQPLVADIELTMLADEAVPVQVKLANSDVYRGANIGMHPVLSSLYMTVMRRDGRQYLHITSLKPLDAEYVHIFLELADGGRRNVRGTTLWLTPDPNPAPPAPVVAPASLAPAATGPATTQLRPPTEAHVAKPAARARQLSAEQARACAALDYKNAALTAQIVELEEKVKLLQLAIEGKQEAAPPVRPAPAKAAPLASAPPKPALAAPKMPGLLIGLGSAAVLALAGGVFVVVRKKRMGRLARAAEAPSDAPKPSFIARVMSRLMPSKKGGEAAPAHIEPSAG